MAFKNFDNDVLTLDRDVVIFRFTIPTNGATTPVRTGIFGNGYTVARTGVGIYTLTPIAGLKWPTRPCVQAHLSLAAVGNTFAQVGGYNTSTGVITVNCVTGSGVAAEWPAANADNILNVSILTNNTSQKPQQA